MGKNRIYTYLLTPGMDPASMLRKRAGGEGAGVNPTLQGCFLADFPPCGGEVRYNPETGRSICEGHALAVFKIGNA